MMTALESLIMSAIEARATHIHIEGGLIKFRVDGLLRASEASAPDVLPGSHAVELQDRSFRIHCSVARTVNGQRAILRILEEPPATPPPESNQAAVLRPLQRALPKLELAITHRQGLIFLTGPARSGLSTSLVAWAGSLDDQQNHLVHWGEDELAISAVTRISGIHSPAEILDLDPDVLLVDRTRDFSVDQLRELGRLSQRFLVICIWPGWSDACEFLLRMKELGLVTSQIRTILNQRLVRKLCPACREQYVIEHPMLAEGTRVFRAVGCPECNGIGYRGQIALFEVVEIGGELKELLLRTTTLARLRQTTFVEALFRDGLEQVKAGHTSLEEAERVLGPAPPEHALDRSQASPT